VVNEGLEKLIGKEVVLDTAGPWVYLGVLTSFDEHGFWLERADVHNVQEGHATREQYVAESSRDGIRVNRQRVFVLRGAVVSLSGLADVVKD
jgi:small nuclear ribonucleoprotein (snRNP)-like protein